MRFAYADPPYPGQGRKLYHCPEIDHRILINSLELNWPDGWALSTSSSALKSVLDLCPDDVRIAAWVKPFASFKPGVNPAYAWEPVIWKGGRPRARAEDTVSDFLSETITLRKGLCGAKPLAFNLWILELLGFRPGEDTLDDLFPGTGGMGQAILELEGRTQLEAFF